MLKQSQKAGAIKRHRLYHAVLNSLLSEKGLKAVDVKHRLDNSPGSVVFTGSAVFTMVRIIHNFAYDGLGVNALSAVIIR